MLNTIISAIKNKQFISFTYSGLERVAEPHAVGLSKAGNDVLCCYQTEGRHITSGHEWDLCTLSKISNLSLTGTYFESARPAYKKGDKRMSPIYAEL